jgi:F0F1-type ATP synthase assembly protein I
MKNEWVKYSSLAFQIVGTMIAAIAGGYLLDKYFQTTVPLFMLSLLIIAVIAILIIIIKTSSKS